MHLALPHQTLSHMYFPTLESSSQSCPISFFSSNITSSGKPSLTSYSTSDNYVINSHKLSIILFWSMCLSCSLSFQVGGFLRQPLGPRICHKYDKTQESWYTPWLCFVTVKGHRLKSTKGKGAWLESKRDQTWASSCPLLVETHTVLILLPIRCSLSNVSHVLPTTGASVCRVFIGGQLYRHMVPYLLSLQLPRAPQIYTVCSSASGLQK